MSPLDEQMRAALERAAGKERRFLAVMAGRANHITETAEPIGATPARMSG